jgi:glucose-6-phosphate isomerase
MDMVLYEKPIRVEFTWYNLFVNREQHPKEVRTLSQMRNVFMNTIGETSNPDMYFMYRNVYKVGDIRYDITTIPASEVGGEYAKTHGHYHPGSEDGLAYPEVYQVLHGTAVFILQKKNRNGSVDTIIVHGVKGDIVLMPPGYGHVTINNGNDILVLGNAVYDRFSSLYTEYEENKGAAYYYLNGGEITQNTNYIVQKNERLRPKELNDRYGFVCSDLLIELSADPKKFEFLQKPKLLKV